MIPQMLLFNPFLKGFVHAHQRKTKSGKTITIKAHTNKRIAKKIVAKDKIRAPWTKDKTYQEVKEKLHTERDSLKKKLEDVRAHKEELLEAKKKGDTHTKRGIKVSHEKHLNTHEKNLHEKLETTNHKIMLHASHKELLREKAEETREKSRKKSTSKEFKNQSEYMDWYRKQSPKIKDEHKLDKKDGKLIASWGEEKKVLPEKTEVKKEVEKIRTKKVAVGGDKITIERSRVIFNDVGKKATYWPSFSDQKIVDIEYDDKFKNATRSVSYQDKKLGTVTQFNLVPDGDDVRSTGRGKNGEWSSTLYLTDENSNEYGELEVEGKINNVSETVGIINKVRSLFSEKFKNFEDEPQDVKRKLIYELPNEIKFKPISKEAKEHSKSRSQSMIGNKNAWKGGAKEKESVAQKSRFSKKYREELVNKIYDSKPNAVKDERNGIKKVLVEKRDDKGRTIDQPMIPLSDLTDQEIAELWGRSKELEAMIAKDPYTESGGKKPSPKKIVVPKEKEITETEDEKTKSRSEAMIGNRNAWKGGPKDEPAKPRTKKIEVPKEKQIPSELEVFKKLPIQEITKLSPGAQKKYFGAISEESYEDVKQMAQYIGKETEKEFKDRFDKIEALEEKVGARGEDFRKRKLRRNSKEYTKFYEDRQNLSNKKMELHQQMIAQNLKLVTTLFPALKDVPKYTINKLVDKHGDRHGPFLSDLKDAGIEISVENKRAYLMGDQKLWLAHKAKQTTVSEYAEKLGISEDKAEGIPEGFGKYLVNKHGGTRFFSKPNTNFDDLLSEYWQKNKAKHSGRGIEVQKDEFKPKISKDNHHDYSNDDHNFILPDLSTKGFVKFTKLELKGEGHETVKRAVKEFEELKKSLIKSEGLERGESEKFRPSNYKIDGGYQIVSGRIFMRVSVSKDKYIYRKDKEEPSKRPQSRKSFIYSPDVQIGSEGIMELKGGWKAEMEMQRTLYNQINHKSAQTSSLLSDIDSIGGSGKRHEFFQKAEYNENSGMIESKIDDNKGKISAELPLGRFKMLLSFYNEGQRRGFSSGYVVPEKNLSRSVRDALEIHQADQDASRERISSTYYEAYLEGRETSFGVRNVENDILDSHGVLIKRQNGKELSSDDKEALKKVVGDTYAAIGNKETLSKMARDKKLKISFSGDKMAYLTKYAGLYVPSESTVVIGRQMTQVLPHEFAHFMDDHLGNSEKSGRGSYASEMTHTSAGKATILGRRTFTKDSKRTQATGGYWNRSCEVFARMVEQYAAVNHYNDESYYGRDGYWTKEKYELIKPEIEKVLTEKFGKSFLTLFKSQSESFPKLLLFKAG